MLAFRVVHDHASLRLEVCFSWIICAWFSGLNSNNFYKGVFGDFGLDEEEVNWWQARVLATKAWFELVWY